MLHSVLLSPSINCFPFSFRLSINKVSYRTSFLYKETNDDLDIAILTICSDCLSNNTDYLLCMLLHWLLLLLLCTKSKKWPYVPNDCNSIISNSPRASSYNARIEYGTNKPTTVITTRLQCLTSYHFWLTFIIY